jgi:hypothetical protein
VRGKGLGLELFIGINRVKNHPGPYLDFRHLKLSCILLKPDKLKASAIDLTLMPDAQLNLGLRSADNANDVGSFYFPTASCMACFRHPQTL